MYRNSFERMCHGLFIYERNYFFNNSSLLLKFNKSFPKTSYCAAFSIFYFANAFTDALLDYRNKKEIVDPIKSGVTSIEFCLIYGKR